MSTTPSHSEIESTDDKAASQRVTWVSVGVNIVLSIGQIICGLFAHSQGLVADGVHSLSDLVADGFVLLALHFGQKQPDEDHPYGHQRYENLATVILGVLLLVVGLGMMWTAVGRLQHPETIAKVHYIALIVAVVALTTKELLFRYMLKVGEQLRSSLLIANAWHARSDAASSLVVGLGIIANMMGFPLADPIAALIVGGMVGKMGAGFTWDALQDLVDRSADAEHVAQIENIILATEGIRGIHMLKTRKTGDMILVDVHLEILGTLTVFEGHAIAEQARTNVLNGQKNVLDVMTHVDPV